jgi:hypothetical protein
MTSSQMNNASESFYIVNIFTNQTPNWMIGLVDSTGNNNWYWRSGLGLSYTKRVMSNLKPTLVVIVVSCPVQIMVLGLMILVPHLQMVVESLVAFVKNASI